MKYHPPHQESFWQSLQWREILEKSHQARETCNFSFGGKHLVIEIRYVGVRMFGAFSLGVDRNSYDHDFFDAGKTFLREKGVIFWQIEYYNITMDGDQSENSSQTYGKYFLEPWTQIINLSDSEEAIWEGMHEKGRYNVRFAQKHGVEVKWVDPTPENIDTWMGLLEETTKRDSFSHNSRAYYERFLGVISENKIGSLCFAYVDKIVISAGIFVFYKNTGIYYYGASTSNHAYRKMMSPYFLQWEAIKEAKKRGCLFYDFLGIAPPDDPENHLKGVTQFKGRFSVHKVFIGRKELITIRKSKYAIFRLLRSVKGALSKMKSILHASP